MQNQRRIAVAALAAAAATGSLQIVGADTTQQQAVFEPFSSKHGFFVEQFENLDRWNPSQATKIDKQQETWSYTGKWSNEEPTVFPGIKGDKGLVATSKAAHHAISSLFETPYDPEQQGGLVVQYEVKLQNGLECGGAYMKLLTADSEHDISAKELSDKTPFTIMFGPDRCGATNKVHFIFRHKNPLTGEIEEKHLKAPPAPRNEKVSALYTLIIRKDNTYEIKINGDSKKTGSLLTDFDPPVNPPKEINDPNDTKPHNWVDEAMITDPDATKPDDWDESAPFEIPDEDAQMPEGWLENEPATIPDSDAEKPEEWSDEDDGDWIAPSIPNPKCETAPGCGPWVRPSKANPAYKGKWFAPKIDNPEYKGVWAPRKIENPDYFEDENPYILSPIAGVAFEWWTMQDGIMVDNIYIGNNEKDAADFAASTFEVKKPIEDALEKAAKPAKVDSDSDDDLDSSDFSIPSFLLDPVNYTREKLTTFLKLASKDPIGTFKAMPQAGSIVGALTATLVGMLGILLGLLAPKAAPAAKEVKAKSKKVAEDVKAKAEEIKDQAAATAAEVSKNVDGEIKKRSGKGKAVAE